MNISKYITRFSERPERFTECLRAHADRRETWITPSKPAGATRGEAKRQPFPELRRSSTDMLCRTPSAFCEGRRLTPCYASLTRGYPHLTPSAFCSERFDVTPILLRLFCLENNVRIMLRRFKLMFTFGIFLRIKYFTS